MTNGFQGKSIIVTGGGSGIGQSTALLVAEAGGSVTVADRDIGKAQETVSQITAAGGQAQAVRVDVANERDVEDMVKQAVSAFGRLDGAANVAGRSSHSLGLHQLALEQWADCIAINLTGPFLCMKHQIPEMLKNGGGSIVVVSSTSAVRAYPGISEYAASKAGVLGLVRCAALEYGKQGIRVNSVMPGTTDTPMMRGHMEKWPEIEEAVKAQHLVGRYGRSDELGHAIRWLLSDEASFVTGINMPVDGGQTAG